MDANNLPPGHLHDLLLYTARFDRGERQSWARRVLARLEPAASSRSMLRLASLGILVLALAVSACTPGMHRAYQRTMAGTASGLFVLDGAQTVAAVRDGYPEGNLAITTVYGDHPRPWQTWSVAGGQALLAPLIVAIPGRIGDDDTGEYLKDGILTCIVALEMFTVSWNAQNVNKPIMSSWH